MDRDNSSQAAERAPELTELTFTLLDKLFLVVIGAEPPSNSEVWDLIRTARSVGVASSAFVIQTAGGAPTELQQRYLLDVIAADRPPIAVLTNGAAIRGAVKAAAVFGGFRADAFGLDDIAAAVAFVGAPTERIVLVARALARLRLRIGMPREGAS